MKGKELLEKMDLIDEKSVQEAVDFRGKDLRRRKVMIAVLSAAAVLVLVSGAVIGNRLIRKAAAPEEESWETRLYPGGNETSAAVKQETVSETMREKPWEEMTIPEKYREFSWRNQTYSVRAAVSAERAGEKLSDISVTGQNAFTGEIHETTAEVYHFNAYAEDAAVLIRFAESPDLYAAVCPWFQPATLGEFLQGVNADQALLVPGSADYLYYDSQNTAHRITFEGMTKEWLMSYLQKYADAPGESMESMMAKDQGNMVSYMSCTVGEAEFDRPAVSLNFTKQGWIWTNLLDAGYAFNIGEEGVQEFEHYIRENLQGYEYVYGPQPGAETKAEETGVEETSPGVFETVIGTTAETVPE